MLTHATDEPAIAAATPDNLQDAPPLELSHQVLATGAALVTICGELDIATADGAVSYVGQVIDHHRGPVIVDLAALMFCDAQGLNALLRMARRAELARCPFQLASPRPSLVKILRITGLDRGFPAPRHLPHDHEAHCAAEARQPDQVSPGEGCGPVQHSAGQG